MIQDSVLETLLVVLYTIKIWTQNLINFIVKFGSKAEICWKLEVTPNGISRITLKFQVICWDIYYFSETLQCRLSNKHKTTNEIQLWKKYLWMISKYGAAGEWLITDEFSTDLNEMGIFVLSKDQTFRICATFLDPAKFSILVIHLVKDYSKNNINIEKKIFFFHVLKFPSNPCINYLYRYVYIWKAIQNL